MNSTQLIFLEFTVVYCVNSTQLIFLECTVVYCVNSTQLIFLECTVVYCVNSTQLIFLCPGKKLCILRLKWVWNFDSKIYFLLLYKVNVNISSILNSLLQVLLEINKKKSDTSLISQKFKGTVVNRTLHSTNGRRVICNFAYSPFKIIKITMTCFVFPIFFLLNVRLFNCDRVQQIIFYDICEWKQVINVLIFINPFSPKER